MHIQPFRTLARLLSTVSRYIGTKTGPQWRLASNIHHIRQYHGSNEERKGMNNSSEVPERPSEQPESRDLPKSPVLANSEHSQKSTKTAKKSKKRQKSRKSADSDEEPRRGRPPKPLPPGFHRPTRDGEPIKSSWKSRTHARVQQVPGSAVLCQRMSASPIWKRDLVSVPPDQYSHVTCSRCRRVIESTDKRKSD